MATVSTTKTTSAMTDRCFTDTCGKCTFCLSKNNYEPPVPPKLCCICAKFGPGKITDRCCHWCECDNKDKRIEQ